MKKLLSMLLALMLILATFAASAETLVNEADRDIKPADLKADGTFEVNPSIEGISPTTGLPWTGRYQPILVQIDNSYGGVDKVRHWGINDADVMYETLLASNGTTRISALFSDRMPESAGPVRSSRVAHAWIRQEWQAGFCFYGVQTVQFANDRDEFIRLGVRNKLGILFDGSAGSNKPWKKFYARVSGISSPHNAEVNVAAVQELIDPAVYAAVPRPFLFTDSKPVEGEYAEYIRKQSVSPSYVYDLEKNAYYRYVGGEPYYDRELGPETGHQAYANVIVQRCDTSFEYGGECPVTPVALHNAVAKGNADIFTGGRFIAGYWMRTGMDERTVFLDANGKEIAFQRGKTFIQVVNNNAEVTYSCDEDVMEQLLAEAQSTIDAERAAEDTDTEELIDESAEEEETEGTPETESEPEAETEPEAEPEAEAEPEQEEVPDEPAEETGAKIYDEPKEGKANAVVKVRKGPSKSYSQVGTLKKGTKVQVLGEDGEWYMIRFQKKDCYVMKEFIDLK